MGFIYAMSFALVNYLIALGICFSGRLNLTVKHNILNYLHNRHYNLLSSKLL